MPRTQIVRTRSATRHVSIEEQRTKPLSACVWVCVGVYVNGDIRKLVCNIDSTEHMSIQHRVVSKWCEARENGEKVRERCFCTDKECVSKLTKVAEIRVFGRSMPQPCLCRTQPCCFTVCHCSVSLSISSLGSFSYLPFVRSLFIFWWSLLPSCLL